MMKLKYTTLIALAFLLVLTIQPVIAYEVRDTTDTGLNLWDLFVEYTFGSFGLSVIILSLLLMLILMMGGISQVTTIAFAMLFIFAMGIGYGSVLSTVSVFGFVIIWVVIEIRKLVSGGQG